VYPENYSSVCAAQKLATPFLERSDAEGFPNHLCGYARACIGYSARMADLDGEIPREAPAGGMPKPTLLVASGEVCDARFKWFQSLGRFFNAPVWTLESPDPGLRERLAEGTYERDVRFLTRELKSFVAFLEKVLGKKMDWDKFSFIGDGTSEINRIRWEINQLRKQKPGPMHTRDFWSAMPAALYRGAVNTQVVIDEHRRMYDEVKYRVDHKIAGINRQERYRLSFEGLPPWHSLGFLEQLANRGWNFVIESSYRPSRPIDIDLSRYGDPIERYVRSRYESLSATIDAEYEPTEAVLLKEEILRTGNSSYLDLKHIRDHQCDGAFLHVLLSCRANSSGLYLLRERMQDVLKVPSLVVEGDIIDTTLFNPDDAMKRAEAFEESMDHYKKARRELGWDW